MQANMVQILSLWLVLASCAIWASSASTPPPMRCTPPFVFHKCGSACNWTCDDGPAGTICNMMCVPRCGCPGLTPVHHKGKCIPYSECEAMAKQKPPPKQGIASKPAGKPAGRMPVKPAMDQICPGNLRFLMCGSQCNRTCKHGNHPPLCDRSCKIGCGCPNEKPVLHNEKCITVEECPARQTNARTLHPTKPKIGKKAPDAKLKEDQLAQIAEALARVMAIIKEHTGQ